MAKQRTLVCLECAELNGMKNKFKNSSVRVMAGMDGPVCFCCERDRGGADILIDRSELLWKPWSTVSQYGIVTVKLADGTKTDEVHYACDLSGCDQPSYEGWFRPIKDTDGKTMYYWFVLTNLCRTE